MLKFICKIFFFFKKKSIGKIRKKTKGKERWFGFDWQYLA